MPSGFPLGISSVHPTARWCPQIVALRYIHRLYIVLYKALTSGQWKAVAQTVIRRIGTKLGLKADSYTEAVQVSIGPSNKTNNPRNTTLPFLNAQHFTVRNPIGVMPKAVVIRQPSLLPFSKWGKWRSGTWLRSHIKQRAGLDSSAKASDSLFASFHKTGLIVTLRSNWSWNRPWF